MKKFVFPALLFLGLAYCTNTYIETQASKKARADARAAKQASNALVIKETAAAYSARYDWYRLFSRPERRLGRPLVQAELENYWIGESPIVFLGHIEDYRNVEPNQYRVKVEHERFLFGYWVSGVGLDLKVSRPLIDQFVASHPSALSGNISNVDGIVMFIAKVNAIEQRWDGAGEDAEKVRYGVGELLAVKFLEGGVPSGKGSKTLLDKGSP